MAPRVNPSGLLPDVTVPIVTKETDVTDVVIDSKEKTVKFAWTDFKGSIVRSVSLGLVVVIVNLVALITMGTCVVSITTEIYHKYLYFKKKETCIRHTMSTEQYISP